MFQLFHPRSLCGKFPDFDECALIRRSLDHLLNLCHYFGTQVIGATCLTYFRRDVPENYGQFISIHSDSRRSRRRLSILTDHTLHRITKRHPTHPENNNYPATVTLSAAVIAFLFHPAACS